MQRYSWPSYFTNDRTEFFSLSSKGTNHSSLPPMILVSKQYRCFGMQVVKNSFLRMPCEWNLLRHPRWPLRGNGGWRYQFQRRIHCNMLNCWVRRSEINSRLRLPILNDKTYVGLYWCCTIFNCYYYCVLYNIYVSVFEIYK